MASTSSTSSTSTYLDLLATIQKINVSILIDATTSSPRSARPDSHLNVTRNRDTELTGNTDLQGKKQYRFTVTAGTLPTALNVLHVYRQVYRRETVGTKKTSNMSDQ